MEGVADKGYAQKTLGEYRNLQLETYYTYEKMISGGHNINLLAGYSYLENMYSGFGAQRRGFDTDLFNYNNLGSGQDTGLTMFTHTKELPALSHFLPGQTIAIQVNTW
jgi:iron complex outermembrane receptor protein